MQHDHLDVQVTSVYPGSEEVARFRMDLLSWFDANRRDLYWRADGVSNYVRIVSEVLLQRTQAAVVSNFLPIFVEAFPSWDAIANSSEDKIGELLRPLGLWRRRAVSLLALATEISRRGGAWPRTRAELETIPAVGQYVASAVLIFEHGERAPLLDASMARVLRRYFAILPEKVDIRYDKLLQATAQIVLEQGDPVALNWAILDFAALQCRKDAAGCDSCAMNGCCKRYGTQQRPDC